MECTVMKCIQQLGYKRMKPEQMNVVISFLRGRDVFAVLPTGFGKTLCYACLPLVFDELSQAKEAKPSIVIVITPLNAIMKDQVSCKL